MADSPTRAVMNYSTFKFCYVEIHPGKGQMKNSLTHIYFYNALKEVFLIFQVKGWVKKVLEFPTLLSFGGGGSYICLQLAGRTFIVSYVYILTSLHWLSILVHKKCKHLSQFEALKF